MSSFFLQKGNIYAVPIIHYQMEAAGQVILACRELQPDCIAVELPETLQPALLHAASRLPDISVVTACHEADTPLHFLVEPCEATFEGLRLALDHRIPAYCVDLDIEHYPLLRDPIPDPYAISRLGLAVYYRLFSETLPSLKKTAHDLQRELYMAKRLKELSLSYDRILFIGGISHVKTVLQLVDRSSFPSQSHVKRTTVELSTVTEEGCREIMSECGWMSSHYEKARSDPLFLPPDRQKLLYDLYKSAGEQYQQKYHFPFPGYHMRNLMKFARNYALVTGRLMPDLYQLLVVASSCVDQNYAYETWKLATEYPYRKNIDALPEKELTAKQIWGESKTIRFRLRDPTRKGLFSRHQREKQQYRFIQPTPFNICSYPPEDIVVEKFGRFLQKKGVQILAEESARIVPFSTSLEDGIDTRETIRHWWEHKIYVRINRKPMGEVGSIVIIFDEDIGKENEKFQEKFPWRTSWLGEHDQESDMAFYASKLGEQVIGPGIFRSEYGGFMMSYPPRRLLDVWHDPDYEHCHSKAETLLMVAIDYAVNPVVVYVSARPPRSIFKNYAARFGKKVVYLPIGQLSPITLNKIRFFHILSGHDKRFIADEYIV